MANLVVIKNGEFYEAYDADRGVTVFSASNQSVAAAFVDNGVVTPETIRLFAQQDVNYQGGVDTSASPVSPVQNPEVPQPAPQSATPSLSSIQINSNIAAGQALNEYGDVYTPLPPVPASEIQTSNSATAGLTPAQLSALGGADPSDPFIRARLDLPPLGTIQPTLVDAVANGLPSISNALPSISSIQTGIANTIGTFTNLFTNATPTSIPADQIQSGATVPAGMALNEYGDAYTQLPSVSESQIQTLADTDTDEQLVQLAGPTDNEIRLSAEAQDEATFQQLVQAFSEADVQTAPAPFAPVAALDETPLVPISEINESPQDIPVQQQGDVLVDLNTGQEYPVDPDSPFVETPGGLNVLPEEIPVEQQGNDLVDLNTGEVLAVDENGFVDQGGLNVLPEDIPNQEAEDQELVPLPGTVDEADAARDPGSYSPEELDAIAAAQGVDAGDGGDIPESALYRNETAAQNPYNTLGIDQGGFTGPLFDTASSRESIDQALRDQARQQQTISQQRAQINNGDWRVRLRLAPGAKYLYNAPNPGILQPLKVTDGVIFPYTPKIDTAYKADYDAYTLTHSNYKGYFYKGSYVDTINLTATFTAQSTAEANYLLAVITFFKSATKMFYGQDAERGAPPPLVYLSGLGEYQFNEHPCVLNQFNFNLPSDVDYVRAGNINNRGQNLVNQRDRQNVATASNFGGLNRLAAAFLTKGALPNVPAPGSLSINRPTYVPTKMDITISLLPIQSRKQVSKQFSLKEFANGNLIKGGFW